MDISIASYAFHGLFEEASIDLFRYLESCRFRYHLDTADIWNGMIPNLDPAYLKKVKHGLEERGLALVNPGDAVIAPWAMHTHISYEIVQNHLEASISMLKEKGYQGAWGVEHHSGKNEYSEVAEQVARTRAVLLQERE